MEYTEDRSSATTRTFSTGHDNFFLLLQSDFQYQIIEVNPLSKGSTTDSSSKSNKRLSCSIEHRRNDLPSFSFRRALCTITCAGNLRSRHRHRLKLSLSEFHLMTLENRTPWWLEDSPIPRDSTLLIPNRTSVVSRASF